jgi:hypothetical protein
MPTREREAYLERAFLHFADICRDQSPLYAALSRRVAVDRDVRALADGGGPRQPPVNLLFGAVHDLLLGGAEHDLAAFYPSVGGRGAWRCSGRRSWWRDTFAAAIRRLGAKRDLAHVSLEWLGDDPGPRLHLTVCRDGEARTTRLADCHHHGAWMHWQA